MNNFDTVINRRGTNSLKYDCAERFGRPADALPLWVADMDFQVPTCVTDALHASVDHAIYGYTESGSEYFAAVRNWFETRHNFKIEESWLVKTPGVVFALGMAVRAYTNRGDAVLIQKPLYHPIENTIVKNGRACIDSTLVYENGVYTIDFADFERKIIEHKIRLFILCNPHNPVGRVWTKSELTEMGRICKKHDCIVVSDEIHCDLVFDGHVHLPFTEVDNDFKDISVLLTAPSKTFNLAGLQVSNVFIPNEKLRNKFKYEIAATGYSQLNTLGLVAAQAAYENCHTWLDDLKDYLTGNAKYVEAFLRENRPEIKVVPLEGTYLMWLDFTALGKAQKEMQAQLDEKKLWLSSGTLFGPTGEGFWRMNIACPRATLEDALSRL